MIVATLCALAVSVQEPAVPKNLPPPGSPPLVRLVEIALPNQGNASLVESETYLYYIHTRPSRPSAGEWVPYDPQGPLDDFKRLWGTGFLDNLWVEVKDVPYENGVVGKHIIFNLEERQRVKIVDYAGSKAIETAKIDEKPKEAHADIRLDTFIDAGLVRKIEGIVREMLQEKGFQFASVIPPDCRDAGRAEAGAPDVPAGRRAAGEDREVNFSGNQSVGDRILRSQLKSNKQRPWWRPTFLGGQSTYQEAKFDEDADLIQQYYRDHGYVTAAVGVPELRPAGDSKDGKTRWVDLHVPVTEGKRYRLGEVTFEGNNMAKTEALRPWFALEPNEYYSERRIRKGLEKARELYGAGGYFEFTGYPDLKPRDEGIVDVMRFVRASVALTALTATVGCQSPTSASSTLKVDDFVDATITPNPATGVASSGKTYRVVRGNNQPDDILPYQYTATFTITVNLNSNSTSSSVNLSFPVTVTAAAGKVEQASGGIVTPPTGGDVEHYESVILASSGSTVAAVGGGITMTFQVWYALPNGHREALVTETISMKDNNGTTFAKDVKVNVAP